MYMYIGAYVTLSVTTMITADASQKLQKNQNFVHAKSTCTCICYDVYADSVG